MVTAAVVMSRDHSSLTARLSTSTRECRWNELNLAVISTAEILRVAHAFPYQS
jgi:hypothetical protein